jgi:hypothetical protein
MLPIPPCGRGISPRCSSAEESRARFFAPLRCAQNDSNAGRVHGCHAEQRNRAVQSKAFTRRSPGERPLPVMLSPFAQFTLSEANGLRVNSARHLALLFLGGRVQSEILRSAALRMTACQTSVREDGTGRGDHAADDVTVIS